MTEKSTTPAERDAEHDDFMRAAAKTFNVIAACKADAREHGYGKGNPGEGEIECSTCGGRVRYAVVGSNGHMRGRCETEGCAKWLE